MAYIVRIDKPKNDLTRGTHGWQVRGPGKRGYHSRLFSDRKHGGREEARSAAEAYRQEVEKLYPSPSHPPPYKDKPQPNNTSGVLGVYRSHQYHGETREKQEYWVAFCPVGPNGRRYSKKFYISDEQDEEESFRLAVELRQMWEEAADQGREAIRQFWYEVESGWL